ncbi:glycosyltransferase [Flavilitoribacter nigricans DSM 23189 = NBRC 102662]|uniref:Glycosyltransferase n=1 Tax=Flavilitoribacter nigricans (strain ATCC 23147 / DSM 23189 / NBRC 102662 / NCIMB 1420 / SS-2) TaxID=1122177 RepID=A0A2D0N5N0_FLAN2|nr:glycosyltransferase [Flavilitoribacter nigricans DSM 23189 = NBRC 102662]
MRIAVNTRFLLKDRLEGIGWYTHEVLRRLVEQHPEHDFIFFFDRPFAPEFIFGPNVEAVVLYPPARHYVLWWWWFEIAVPRALRRHRADVFLSFDGYCSLQTEVPTLMVTHDIAHVHYPDQIPGWARHYYHRFVPRYLQRADRIVTVSEFVRQDILRHYSPTAEKIIIAGNGCKSVFHPVPAERQTIVREKYSNGKPYFFYLGALHPRKNIERLIRAFGRFKQEQGGDIQLLIGGRLAWQSAAIKQTWERSEVRDDIHWLGYVPDSELPDLLGSALALTYVSLFEGFGVPLLEAMHAEVPVITSNVSSMPEVAGDAALLVDPESETAIAEAMRQIATDAKLRRRLIEAGKKQRAQYSWDKTADIIWRTLKDLQR